MLIIKLLFNICLKEIHAYFQELSELQGKTKRQEVETEDSEKCVKLTEVVSSKSKEITELKNE